MQEAKPMIETKLSERVGEVEKPVVDFVAGKLRPSIDEKYGSADELPNTSEIEDHVNKTLEDLTDDEIKQGGQAKRKRDLLIADVQPLIHDTIANESDIALTPAESAQRTDEVLANISIVIDEEAEKDEPSLKRVMQEANTQIEKLNRVPSMTSETAPVVSASLAVSTLNDDREKLLRRIEKLQRKCSRKLNALSENPFEEKDTIDVAGLTLPVCRSIASELEFHENKLKNDYYNRTSEEISHLETYIKYLDSLKEELINLTDHKYESIFDLAGLPPLPDGYTSTDAY